MSLIDYTLYSFSTAMLLIFALVWQTDKFPCPSKLKLYDLSETQNGVLGKPQEV